MKHLLTIWLSFVFLAICFAFMVSHMRQINTPWVLDTDTVDHVSDGEYFGLIYKASTHQAYQFLGVIPTLVSGQPPYVTEIYGGPHDFLLTGIGGTLYGGGTNSGGELGIGSTSPTSGSAMVPVSADSAGAAITGVVQVVNSGVTNAPYWFTMIVTSAGQMGLAGFLDGGVRGDGVSSITATKFVWVTFPGGAFIVKATGLLGCVALDSAGNVWTWGNNNNLQQVGRGGSANYKFPGKVTLPTGYRAIDIAGAGAYTAILCDSNGKRKLIGIGDHPKYFGNPSATASSSPQDFTAYLTNPANNGMTSPVAKVFANNGSIYYICQDSTLHSTGDNICGTLGNGDMFNMANYKCCPGPSSGTAAPYAYDNNLEEYMYSGVVTIAPGTHNWVCGYTGISNCWFAHFVNNKGELYGWGRRKAGQLVDGFASCNYISGGLNGSRPDALNFPWPHKISPFFTTAIQVNCLTCYTDPGFDANCSQCTLTQGTAPTGNAGALQNLPFGTTSTTMSGSATPASGKKIYSTVYSFVSGPTTPVIPFPGSVSTTNTTPVYNLTTGQYIFQMVSTDQTFVSSTSYDTINVASNGCANCITLPVNVKFH